MTNFFDPTKRMEKTLGSGTINKHQVKSSGRSDNIPFSRSSSRKILQQVF